jgi:hypothetical protein
MALSCTTVEGCAALLAEVLRNVVSGRAVASRD